ncbi:hypothetical protein CYMTET_53586 [Cymbomonas tetramitiformis]|uniref:Uncharacterized protein n=1 Tax=Cymbomonas tetramitiformis TaxID=36881 RepID=A0AAE0ERK6_9CHLO|nr:hypothetical protein CYMTET_53586 [Cymbomonas tetramitiformis]
MSSVQPFSLEAAVNQAVALEEWRYPPVPITVEQSIRDHVWVHNSGVEEATTIAARYSNLADYFKEPQVMRRALATKKMSENDEGSKATVTTAPEEMRLIIIDRVEGSAQGLLNQKVKMAAFENANDRKALKGTIPGRQLHPGKVWDESPGICENLLREQEAAPGSELRQEASEPKAQVHGGADGGAGDAADRDILDVVDRDHHSRFLPRYPEEARKEAISTLPSNMQELEAAATLADIVQGLGLQYFCRERDLDGHKVALRRWYTGGGQQVERPCTLGRPSEEEVDFQRQLTCPFREDVRRVFLQIRAKESAKEWTLRGNIYQSHFCILYRELLSAGHGERLPDPCGETAKNPALAGNRGSKRPNTPKEDELPLWTTKGDQMSTNSTRQFDGVLRGVVTSKLTLPARGGGKAPKGNVAGDGRLDVAEGLCDPQGAGGECPGPNWHCAGKGYAGVTRNAEHAGTTRIYETSEIDNTAEGDHNQGATAGEDGAPDTPASTQHVGTGPASAGQGLHPTRRGHH